VIWLRNGKELKSSDDYKIERDGTTVRLTIRQATADDAGAYQCEASGSVYSTATLFVNVPGKPPVLPVVKSPQPVTVKAGSAAKFILELTDLTNLTVQWFKGADKVEKSDNVKSVKVGNTFKLDFKSAGTSDAGCYVVKVIKDKKAIAKYTASLNVLA